MIKYLTDLECIQFERLLLLRSKELSLSDQESHLLLLIYTFSSLRKKMITPTLLLQYSSLTPQEMDHVLESLLHKKWISNKNGAICLNNFIKRLLEKEEEVVEEESDEEQEDEEVDEPKESKVVKVMNVIIVLLVVIFIALLGMIVYQSFF